MVIDTDGCNFRDVLSHPLIDSVNTVCNDMWQVYQTLGIEASRIFLIEEFTQVLCSGGSYINPRHVMLLIDSMTQTGTITSIRREGIDRRSVGPIAKASFEKTFENFIEASAFTEQDTMSSVSSRITLGSLIASGSGTVHVDMEPSYIPKYEKATGIKVKREIEQKRPRKFIKIIV